MANTLFLRLEAPLQSWGERSQWSERDTAPEPTKSGIVGLLACALGWNEDARLRELSGQIRVGVRCDVPGTPAPLRDYHTVGGGYNEPQLLTAKGAPKYIPNTKDPHTEPTWRYYLCDASFLVAVQSDDEKLVADLAEAIQNPHWTLYLGRKCCVPTRPPFDGVGNYDSLDAALEEHPTRLVEQQRHVERQPRVVVECDSRREGAVRRRDQLVSRKYWLHEPRYAYERLSSREIQAEYVGEGV